MTRHPSRTAVILACLIGVLSISPLNSSAQQRGLREFYKEATEGAFTDVTRVASLSTVQIRIQELSGGKRMIALGTVVSKDGYILTKASEVRGHNIFVGINRNGVRDLSAKIVGWSEPLDLAMLKVESTDLVPISFADTRPPTTPSLMTVVNDPPPPPAGRGGGRGGRGGRGPTGPIPTPGDASSPPDGAIQVQVGAWVATADAGATLGQIRQPRQVGIISAARRRIAKASGFLGVQLEDAPDGAGAKITQVVTGSAAAAARVQNDDVITAINGTPIRNGTDLKNTVSDFRAGTEIVITVARGAEQLSLRTVLGDISGAAPDAQELAMLSGDISKRANDFPAVFQHDTVLNPNECGGPLVDLEGHVIGINIARVGRTESYALPADLIIPLIEPMKSGKLAPVNSNVPSTRPATNR